jgi:hypothetical protein
VASDPPKPFPDRHRRRTFLFRIPKFNALARYARAQTMLDQLPHELSGGQQQDRSAVVFKGSKSLVDHVEHRAPISSGRQQVPDLHREHVKFRRWTDRYPRIWAIQGNNPRACAGLQPWFAGHDENGIPDLHSANREAASGGICTTSGESYRLPEAAPDAIEASASLKKLNLLDDLIRAAGGIRALGELVAARVNFRTEDRYLFGRLDADLDNVTVVSSHLQSDAVPNNKFLVNLAG